MDFESTYNHTKKRLLALLESGLSPRLTYHNMAHTRDVVESMERIFDFSHPERTDTFYLLKFAALFHDSGFLDRYEEHEARSAEIASLILKEEGLDKSQIETVRDIILATKADVVPVTEPQKIIKDADLDYLGREDFFEIAKKLYTEWDHFGRLPAEANWTDIQIRFLENHRYYTEFGKTVREPVKQQHLKTLKEIVS